MQTSRASRAPLALLLLFCGSCLAELDEAYGSYKHVDHKVERHYKDYSKGHDDPEDGYYKRYDAELEQAPRTRPWKEEIPEWTFSDGPEPAKEQPKVEEQPAATPAAEPKVEEQPAATPAAEPKVEDPSATPAAEAKKEDERPSAAPAPEPKTEETKPEEPSSAAAAEPKKEEPSSTTPTEPNTTDAAATPAAEPKTEEPKKEEPSNAAAEPKIEQPNTAPETKVEPEKPVQAVAQPPAPVTIRGEPGPVGPRGQPGAPGATGQAGTSGINGNPGQPGPRGVPGIAGPPGMSGSPGQPGQPGPRGTPGAPGASGATGQRGTDGQMCAQGTKAYSYTLPVSTEATALRGPLGLSGSCPRSTTLGGSCKVTCKDPRNTDRILNTETRLVSSPPQDWANVTVSDMPVFCKWDLRTDVADVPEKFECDFAVRVVCCADTAQQLATTVKEEIELNPNLRGPVAKTASERDMGTKLEGVRMIVVKVSGPAAAEIASSTSR